MSESAGGAATGGNIGPSDAAAGGTPTESDLPNLQGLGEDADLPGDAERSSEESGGVPFDTAPTSGGGSSSSDPMPDISGA